MRFQSTLSARALRGALVATALLAGVPALADEPAKPAAAAETTPPAKPAAREAQGGLTDMDVVRAFKKYRKQVRDGNTVYCRNEKPVGTRIGKQVCYTEDQVLSQARLERDQQDKLSNMNICGAGDCTPGS